jgi:antitoxin ParD1/3/4
MVEIVWHVKNTFAISSFSVYFSGMSTVVEVKSATEQLSAEERWELYRWLGESKDVQRLRLEDLRREIAMGVEQADRGEVVPLDVQSIKDEIRRRTKGN